MGLEVVKATKVVLDSPEALNAHAIKIGLVVDFSSAGKLWKRVDEVAIEKKIARPLVISAVTLTKKYSICEIPYRKVDQDNWEDFETSHIMSALHVADAAFYEVKSSAKLGFLPCPGYYSKGDQIPKELLPHVQYNPNFNPYLHLEYAAGSHNFQGTV